MDTANAKRIAWFMRLQRILQFQRQHLAPRQAALRPQRPTKDDFSADSSSHVALGKLAAFSAGHSDTLARGYKRPALVNGPTNRSGVLAAHIRVPAMKTDVIITNRIRDNPLSVLPLIDGLRNRHQLLPGRNWSHPVGGVRIPTRMGDEADRFLGPTLEIKHPKIPTQLRPTNDPAYSPSPRLRRSPVSNAPSLPAVENAKASRLPSARYSADDIRDESSLRARPPPKDEQSGLNGFANQASQVGQEGRSGASAYKPQLSRASSSATMIHIDGSVLGRWAVQHLERALGKPATGMTGVDPRASPPRSRVSPF